MSEWIPVIAALAGALIGGLISYRATVARLVKEEKSEKRTIILEKLEETHLVARTIRLIFPREGGRIVKTEYTL